jgi:hypothetical protein
LQAILQAVFRHFKVVPALKVHPEALGQTEIAGKPQGGVRRDSPLAVNNLIDFSGSQSILPFT